jgi:hypothetical protein
MKLLRYDAVWYSEYERSDNKVQILVMG